MVQASDASIDTSWWTRPAGGREVLRVAMPLVISSLSWTVMTFVDRVFLNWLSGTAMAAAFSASVVWFFVMCLPLGICTYANAFVSQYFGSHQPERIGVIVWQAVWCALLGAPLVLLAIPLAPTIFGWAGHESQTYAYEVQYFQILCVGGPAMLIAQAAASFYSGRGETWVVMWVDAGAAVLNLVLDYLWIFGYGGFPEWGVAGAAWATTLSFWVKAAAYILLMLQGKHREQYGTARGLRLDWHLLGRMLYFGGPSGLQMLLDVLGFSAFILLIGRLGSLESEATTMAFSVSTLGFMPIWGLGLAVGILVGQHLGEDRDDLAARATYTSLWIAWAYMIAISAFYIFLPRLFLHGFFAAESTRSPEEAAVEHLAVLLLRFVAAYNLLDATFMIFVNAIKGAGDTVFVLHVSLVLSVLLASLSYLSVEVWELGVFGCWALITAWVWLAALSFFGRFRQGKWREMRVIESPPAQLPEVFPAAAE